MEILELKLKVDEINNIIFALGKLPFEQVFQLVNNIQVQCNEQIKRKNEQKVEDEKPIDVKV
jgi:hypothetical protein